MGTSAYFDKTAAVHIKPARTGGDINRTTGAFTRPAQTTANVKVHVSRPKLEEAFPGGLAIQIGDVIVHAENALNIEVSDTLTFHGTVYRVVASRPYDVLGTVVNHTRTHYLCRPSRPEED